MGNGTPGDHWYADIVVHGLPTLSAEADRLVVTIRSLGGEQRGCEPVTALVEAHLARARLRRSRSGQPTAFVEHHLEPAELRVLEHELRALCTELERS